MTFKVGDRVRVPENTFPEGPGYPDPTRLNGQVGEIIKISDSELLGVQVKFDSGVWPGPGEEDVAPYISKGGLEPFSIQDSTFHYLASGGGSVTDRQQALADLALLQFFVVTPSEAEEMLRDYLNTNSRGFCQEGIKRFLKHVGLKELDSKDDRSPLHEDAVNLDDLLPGDVIQRYHRGGLIGTYIFLSSSEGSIGTHVNVIRLGSPRSPSSRHSSTFYARDSGLARYKNGRWNSANYVLRAKHPDA